MNVSGSRPHGFLAEHLRGTHRNWRRPACAVGLDGMAGLFWLPDQRGKEFAELRKLR